MPVMERRLQLLLDSGRYRRVAAEAERSGRSVAAVIREAIDFRFPDEGDDLRTRAARTRAARALLEISVSPDDEAGAEGPADLKADYARQLDEKLAAQ